MDLTVENLIFYFYDDDDQELEAMTCVKFEPVSLKLLKFLQDGNRLKQPTNCPKDIYELMLKCWEYE